jgi:hypothetical protein
MKSWCSGEEEEDELDDDGVGSLLGLLADEDEDEEEEEDKEESEEEDELGWVGLGGLWRGVVTPPALGVGEASELRL